MLQSPLQSLKLASPKTASTMARWVKNPPAMQESQERQVPSLGHKDPWEEGMATLSSILFWRIPWREEPSGLQSIGSAKSRARQAPISLKFSKQE